MKAEKVLICILLIAFIPLIFITLYNLTVGRKKKKIAINTYPILLIICISITVLLMNLEHE